MDRVSSFSPTPSSSVYQPLFYDGSQIVYAQIDPSLQFEGGHQQPMMTPHGQMVMPMSSAPSVQTLDCDPSPYMQSEMSPYPHPSSMHASMHPHIVSPSDHLDQRHHASMLQRNNSMPGRPMSQGRPMMSRNHSIQVPSRPTQLHRQASLQSQPIRSASPHMMAGDLFDPLPGSPIKRPATVAVEAQQQHYEAQQMVSAFYFRRMSITNPSFSMVRMGFHRHAPWAHPLSSLYVFRRPIPR
jgi:hypothetical protein